MKQFDVIILAGGLGTRLRPVIGTSLPKCLAPVNGKPFIDKVVNFVTQWNPDHIVMALGYHSDLVQRYFSERSDLANINFSVENEVLGTGGALRLALQLVKSDLILIGNGDTFCDFDLEPWMDFHLRVGAELSICATMIDNASRYGTLRFDESRRLIGFKEKGECPQNCYISCGYYLACRKALEDTLNKINETAFSFEHRVLQDARLGLKTYVWLHQGTFLDIGTPEDFRQAGSVLGGRV